MKKHDFKKPTLWNFYLPVILLWTLGPALGFGIVIAILIVAGLVHQNSMVVVPFLIPLGFMYGIYGARKAAKIIIDIEAVLVPEAIKEITARCKKLGVKDLSIFSPRLIGKADRENVAFIVSFYSPSEGEEVYYSNLKTELERIFNKEVSLFLPQEIEDLQDRETIFNQKETIYSSEIEFGS